MNQTESKGGLSLYCGTLGALTQATGTLQGQEQVLAQMRANFVAQQGQAPEDSEVGSWRGTLRHLRELCGALTAEQRDIGVMLEFALPNDDLGRRIDVLLVGKGAAGRAAVLVVELKGWQEVLPPLTPEEQERRVVFIHGKERKHPVPQVLDYQYDLQFHNSAVLGRQAGVACAVYLPGLSQPLPDVGGLTLESVFYKGELQPFAQFVQAQVGQGISAEFAAALDTSTVAWTRDAAMRVTDAVARAAQGDTPYTLSPQQREVARSIWKSAVDNVKSQSRQIILVRGDPGTGKTALALQLLASASENFVRRADLGQPSQGQYVKLVIPGAFLSTTLKAALPFDDNHQALTSRLFGYPKGMQSGEIPLVLCDEAHRIPNGVLKKVVQSGRTVVLFYDEYQVIDPTEGQDLLELTADVRQGHRTYLDIPVRVIDHLPQQMRCCSPSYVAWAKELIQGQPHTRVKGYELTFFDDPAALEEHVQRLGGRLLAGFCWPWNKTPEDVQIGDWKRPWNPTNNRAVNPQLNSQVRWMKGEGFEPHIGCIYTAQGVDFEHAGVIWGDDVVWRTDHWEVRVGENKFGVFQNIANKLRTATPEERRELEQVALRCLLNIYYVLMTRGRQSTSLHFTDPETARYVRACWERAQL